jgi:protein-S-isoprenylcysteine O-methyltransferase Ste14
MHLRPPFPFPGSISTWIFWAAFLLWVVPEIIGWIFKRSSVTSTGGSLKLVSALWPAGIIAGFLASDLIPKATMHARQPMFSSGVALMLAGVIFRWYSAGILGKFFTFDVAINARHVLIERGPYRFIRHPSYCGALISILGFGFALGNWISLAVSFLCLAIAYGYRIPVEESAMIHAFGDEYKQYQRNTWRLVPFVF